jgi:hypothetical protein
MHSRKPDRQNSLWWRGRLHLKATRRNPVTQPSPIRRGGPPLSVGEELGVREGRGVNLFAILACLLFVTLAIPSVHAQSAKLQLAPLERLASKAQEVTDVTLDRQLLQLALNFMSKDEEGRQLIQDLKGVYIRSYEFSRAGEYSRADVDGILAQLRTAPWQRVVSDRNVEQNETDEIYIMGQGNSIRGLAIISAEPKELTVVNIVGPIDLRKLSELEGHFGIPRVKLNHTKGGSGHGQGN